MREGIVQAGSAYRGCATGQRGRDRPAGGRGRLAQVIATRGNVKGFKLHPSGFDLRVEHVTRE